MDKLGPRRKTFTSQDGTLHREQFLQTYEIVYETKMCEDFPLTFFNLKLIKQQKSKLELNCQAQVQVQVPGQVQKVQGLRAKDLDLG